MTTISQIITDAYQYNNLVALSAIPNAAEQAKALRYLNRIFRSIFGYELGDQLTVWNIGENGVSQFNVGELDKVLHPPYNVPPNSRLVLNLSGSTTIYLPRSPQDGGRFAVQDIRDNLSTFNLTINGNGRKIENTPTIVLSTNGTNSEWFFRVDLGNWVKITDLSLTDNFPLPSEFEEFFITMLAIRLGASESVDLNNQLAIVLKDTTRKLKSRYKQTVSVPSEPGLLKTVSNRSRIYNYEKV